MLCHLVGVPNMCERRSEVLAAFKDRHERGESLLLPLVVVLETGNHIGQQGPGGARRAAAERFVTLIQRAMAGQLPFTPTRPITPEILTEVIAAFVEPATRGVGLGDCTILDEAEQQRRLHRTRPVTIWSFDEHLAAHG